MTTLLPCPFCGSSAVLNCPFLEAVWYVPLIHCTGCDSDKTWDAQLDRRVEAVALGRSLWNTRTASANCKPSECCPDELLVPMHSTNTKMCTGCKKEQPWPLEPGQKRTFD